MLSTQVTNQEEKIEALEAEIVSYQKRCDEYAAAYDQLQNQLRELLRH